jgi:hypothetical protein
MAAVCRKEHAVWEMLRLALQSSCLRQLFEVTDVAEAEEKRNSAEDSEAAIDKPPRQRDATDRAGDQGKRKDRDAGDYAKLKHPFITDRIAQRAEKDDSQHKMREGEPIGSVSEEGIEDACVAEGTVHLHDPNDDRLGKDGMVGQEVREPACLSFEREGGEAAKSEAEDEDG